MNIPFIRLGRTGMQVTCLGFGGIPIQRLNDAEAIAVVKRCLDLGINFLDTANAYSTSEGRIGRAVAGRRHQVFIATKTHPVSAEIIRKNLALSLERLQTDYIDLYQLHGVSDFNTLDRILAPDGLLPVLEEMKKEGLIRHIGITSHQIDVAKKAVQSGRFETLMFPFNFLSPEAAEVLLPVCREQDTGFIAMKPMAGGMVDKANVCIKYLLQFPDVVFIPGFEKVAEVEEIARIVRSNKAMTGAEIKQMALIKAELGPRFCHRCDYCQPCTAGIPISMIMTVKSFHKRVPLERFFGDMVKPAMEKAAKCTDCGKCEERCPYHLPIRKMIAEQIEWYEEERKRYCRETGKE